MSSGGKTAVWKHCQGYQEAEQEKRNGTWNPRNNCTWYIYVDPHYCRERDDGIPDLATLVKTGPGIIQWWSHNFPKHHFCQHFCPTRPVAPICSDMDTTLGWLLMGRFEQQTYYNVIMETQLVKNFPFGPDLQILANFLSKPGPNQPFCPSETVRPPRSAKRGLSGVLWKPSIDDGMAARSSTWTTRRTHLNLEIRSLLHLLIMLCTLRTISTSCPSWKKEIRGIPVITNLRFSATRMRFQTGHWPDLKNLGLIGS